MSSSAVSPGTTSSRWRRARRSPVVHILAAFLVLAVVQLFFVKPFQVPSESMSPTLQTGDRILVNRVALTISGPAAGDIVVFSRPETWRDDAAPRSPIRTAIGWVGDIVGFGPSNLDALVKRVIGEPGTTVRCCSSDGRVEVNGTALDEDYVHNDLPFVPGQLDCETSPASPRCFGPISVPENSYLVMGDNRGNSADSVVGCRGAPTIAGCARFVPRPNMIGQVFAVVWPLDRVLAPLD